MAFWFAAMMVLAICMALLALPPALIQKSRKRFALGFVLSLFVVILPLVFFFLSAFLTPEAKSLCHYGALDCFHTGKLALAPFVLWATAALYAVEIAKVPNPSRPWIINGLILGAIISSACAIFGIIVHGLDSPGLWVCLLVPLYTSVWYVAWATRICRTQPVDSTKTTIAVTTSLPFWALSALWTYKTYLSLPEQPNSCFVVTAASRGHRKIVGPFLNVTHRGSPRIVNQQLAMFWAFEALWQNNAPRTHATFRRIYNIVGPILARRITTPWIADALYLALKPAEIFARLIVNAPAFQAVKSEPRHLGSNISYAHQS
jgi:hypothetical protein